MSQKTITQQMQHWVQLLTLRTISADLYENRTKLYDGCKDRGFENGQTQALGIMMKAS